jgi:predicted ATP-dependent endonuclease of OLD family
VNFIDLNKKLFNKYPVKFPIEEDLIILIGENGTGKTKTLEAVNEYFKEHGENTLYFPYNRKLTVTKEDIIKTKSMSKLLNINIFDTFDIKLNRLQYIKKGTFINSGFVQIINFITNIMFLKEESIILIDLPEKSLHTTIRRKFINEIQKLPNIKKLIIVTHSPEIIVENSGSAIDIEYCVKLR